MARTQIGYFIKQIISMFHVPIAKSMPAMLPEHLFGEQLSFLSDWKHAPQDINDS